MSFPNFGPAFTEHETFFEPTRIWLFGKPFTSLIYNRAAMDPEFVQWPHLGAAVTDIGMPPRRIERTLRRRQRAGGVWVDPIFARIYSFSFEGHYYNLPRPLLFLVYGNGIRRPEEVHNAPGNAPAAFRDRHSAFRTKRGRGRL